MSVWSWSEQYCDRSMMGTLPKNTLGYSSVSIVSIYLPVVASISSVVVMVDLAMSMYSGAE